MARVSSSGLKSEPFLIESGVKQRCVIAPILFNLFSCCSFQRCQAANKSWRWYQAVIPARRQSLQLATPSCQNACDRGGHPRVAICRWHCSNELNQRGSPAHHRCCLRYLLQGRTSHQYKQNTSPQYVWTTARTSSIHNQSTATEKYRRIHLSWVSAHWFLWPNKLSPTPHRSGWCCLWQTLPQSLYEP